MPARRALLAAPAFALAASLAGPLPALASPSGSAREPGPMPAPRAVTADGRPAKIADVLENCRSKPSGCSFQIDRKLGIEFATTVRSLGNAVVNCTQNDMNVERVVTLHAVTTDNINGEISGSVTAEGSIQASGEVTTNLGNESGTTHKSPDLSKGPTTEAATKVTVGGGAKVAGGTSARLAFQAAFKAAFSKTWSVDTTETTTYKSVVKAHDMLVFGATVAMRRIVGQLNTGAGSVLNVAVDSPSMVNDSHFIAQTYTAPDGLCSGKRPPGDSSGDNDNTRPAPGPGRLRGSLREIPAATAVPSGATPRREVVLHASSNGS
ncbi:hypothetical protein [Streptomyces yangpuensis]|uniref:hypothetical protein n=1 Tax=Streptomyces yangpuensis TaxID=1648182 RepID=UPI0038177229